MNEKESKWLFSEIHPATPLFWSLPTAKKTYSTGRQQGDWASQQLSANSSATAAAAPLPLGPSSPTCFKCFFNSNDSGSGRIGSTSALVGASTCTRESKRAALERVALT